MKKYFALISLFVFLSGCGSLKPLDKADAESMKGKTLAVVLPLKLNLEFAKNPIYNDNAISTYMREKDGEQFIQEHKNVRPPSDKVGEEMARVFEGNYSMAIPNPPTRLDTHKIDEIIAKTPGNPDYIFKFNDWVWSIAPLLKEPDVYGVFYNGLASIIDVKNKREIAAIFCDTKVMDNYRFTYQEVTAEDSAKLNESFVAAGKECTESLKTKMLGLLQ